MSLICFVVAPLCLFAAIQERKDSMRCVGFILFGVTAIVLGFISNR